jgi:hypothetical protein
MAYEKLKPKSKTDIHKLPPNEEKEEKHVPFGQHVPKFDRTRRITGYLSSLPQFNQGKRAEEKDRIKHDSITTEEVVDITDNDGSIISVTELPNNSADGYEEVFTEKE